MESCHVDDDVVDIVDVGDDDDVDDVVDDVDDDEEGEGDMCVFYVVVVAVHPRHTEAYWELPPPPIVENYVCVFYVVVR